MSKTTNSRRVPGVYVTLDELLKTRLHARDVNLSKQRKILSQQSGSHASRFRGRGIDFTEVRTYHPGDDIRNIDWRVTARTGKPHTKLYAEERERPVLIICDQSQAMFFGSRKCFKSVLATHIATTLAWSALARGDRVGGLVFSDNAHTETRPKRSHHAVLHFIEELIAYNHELKQKPQIETSISLSNTLQHARRITRPGSEIFIISDFYDMEQSCRHHLFQLSRHNDLVAIQTYDELEANLPPPGIYPITNGRQRILIDLFSSDLASQYRTQWERRNQQLTKTLGELSIPLIPIKTNESIVSALQTGLGLRRTNSRPLTSLSQERTATDAN